MVIFLKIPLIKYLIFQKFCDLFKNILKKMNNLIFSENWFVVVKSSVVSLSILNIRFSFPL